MPFNPKVPEDDSGGTWLREMLAAAMTGSAKAKNLLHLWTNQASYSEPSAKQRAEEGRLPSLKKRL